MFLAMNPLLLFGVSNTGLHWPHNLFFSVATIVVMLLFATIAHHRSPHIRPCSSGCVRPWSWHHIRLRTESEGLYAVVEVGVVAPLVGRQQRAMPATGQDDNLSACYLYGDVGQMFAVLLRGAVGKLHTTGFPWCPARHIHHFHHHHHWPWTWPQSHQCPQKWHGNCSGNLPSRQITAVMIWGLACSSKHRQDVRWLTARLPVS